MMFSVFSFFFFEELIAWRSLTASCVGLLPHVEDMASEMDSILVIALMFLFGMKEHTRLAFVASTCLMVDAFRRMPVKTWLIFVTLVFTLQQSGLSVAREGLVPVCLPSVSLDLRCQGDRHLCLLLPLCPFSR